MEKGDESDAPADREFLGLMQREEIFLKVASTYRCEYRMMASKFRLVLVGADVFEIKRQNACPVCVWGLPQTNKGTLL